MTGFDFLESISGQISEYSKRLSTLKEKNLETKNIEQTVAECIENINKGHKSFVIYGEPQCGKTELMIALSAKLIDNNNKIIVILLNDDTELLSQNLRRFRSSGINPTPCNFADVLEEKIGTRRWIIFCKKNRNDLIKLNSTIKKIPNKIIIDDEGDYASPNSKVNKEDKTKINFEIENLLRNDGIYIGVTATPARLDLNNTFDNLTEKWIQFKPHENYVGKNIFFPINKSQKLEYSLCILPDTGDKPEYIRKALANFIVNTSILCTIEGLKQNYSFLIHTSGEVDEHSKDKKDTVSYMDALIDKESKNHKKYWEEIIKITNEKVLLDKNRENVLEFAYNYVSNQSVTILNSKNKKNNIGVDTSDPSSIFTIFIGGNKVSRGITFGNLLGMFFTRDALKIQQDTYIQRARMFGNRKKYLKHFELWITEDLYSDWHRCFMYHHLSLESIKSNGTAPVWIGDNRIRPVASASIEKRTLILDKGEMAFAKFTFDTSIEDIFKMKNSKDIVNALFHIMDTNSFPKHVYNFVTCNISNESTDINVLLPRFISPDKDSEYEENLYRKRGTFGGTDIKSLHNFLITYNSKKEARLLYYFNGKVNFFKKIK